MRCRGRPASTTRALRTFRRASVSLTATGTIFQSFSSTIRNTRYVYGLDPNYLYSENPDLYKLLLEITEGKTKDAAPIIREKFGAEYIFADAKENDDMIAKALESGWVDMVYEDDEARILKIRDRKRANLQRILSTRRPKRRKRNRSWTRTKKTTKERTQTLRMTTRTTRQTKEEVATAWLISFAAACCRDGVHTEPADNEFVAGDPGADKFVTAGRGDV